jgi:hypothetical protein
MWEDQRGRIEFPHEKLTPKRIDELLEHLASEKRVADLADVEVWIAGARIHRDSPRVFEDGVEGFWLAAFSRMGAKATAEHCAPSLRDFPTNPELFDLLMAGARAARATSVAERITP